MGCSLQAEWPFGHDMSGLACSAGHWGSCLAGRILHARHHISTIAGCCLLEGPEPQFPPPFLSVASTCRAECLLGRGLSLYWTGHCQSAQLQQSRQSAASSVHRACLMMTVRMLEDCCITLVLEVICSFQAAVHSAPLCAMDVRHAVPWPRRSHGSTLSER